MEIVRMPAYFLSHGGGPWPHVESMRQQYARTEREFRSLPSRLPAKPRAILVISGHWEAEIFTVSTAEHPGMEYDYYGFPEHTYHIKYPAPGSPSLAKRVREMLLASGIHANEDAQRGFDHGVFVPLELMYPQAELPVVMLSLKSGYDVQEHIRAGQALAPLRKEGVLIIGSGLTYHNMRGFGQDGSAPVAAAFQSYLDEAIQAEVAVRNDMLLDWEAAPGARLAHPREDHLLPLMVVAGAAESDIGRKVCEDYAMKVPMASYEFWHQPQLVTHL